MAKAKPRPQACSSCRLRKSKCDMVETFPCTNCRRASVQCTKPLVDKRTIRISSDRSKLLEEKANSLEREKLDLITSQGNILQLANKIQNFSQQIKLALGDRHLPDPLKKLPEDFERELSLTGSEIARSESLSVYGPSSLFDNEHVEGASQDVVAFRSRNHDPIILKCIKLFFIWLYPDVHHFLYREAFLLEFFHPKPNLYYCSEELILAICAMGSRISRDDTISAMSFDFYNRSRTICLSKIDKPSLPLLQSFLLLGLYDIYNCRNNSGWMLTGMGLRVGSTIGFHLDPQNWFLQSNECDVGIRSRIFWGAYLVDHLTGLFLGRTPVLKIQEVSIMETANLPDITWIDAFTYRRPNENPKTLEISDPLKACVQLMNIAENMLQDVFNDPKNLMAKFDLVALYNHEIVGWRNDLPTHAQWNIETLRIDGDDPSRITTWLLYYMIILCLNRPFISHSRAEQDGGASKSFSQICDTAVGEFYVINWAILKTHGQLRCSFLVIYLCILSATAILASHENIIYQEEAQSELKAQFLTFIYTLKSCSNIWELSGKAYKLIQEKVYDRLKVDVDLEIQKSAKLKNLSNEFSCDFDRSRIARQQTREKRSNPPVSDDFLGWENLFQDINFNF